MTHEFFIVLNSDGIYGEFGKGKTIEDARKQWKKAGGKKRCQLYREIKFTSQLPFAPSGRKATENEADAWVGQDGSLNWIRCEKEVLLEVRPKGW